MKGMNMKRRYLAPETLLIHAETAHCLLTSITEDGSSPTPAGTYTEKSDDDDDDDEWIVMSKRHSLWDEDSGSSAWNSWE